MFRHDRLRRRRRTVPPPDPRPPARPASGPAGRPRARGCTSASPGVSKHLKVLRETGLVEVRPDGKRRWYALRAEPLAEVAGWLELYRGHWLPSVSTPSNSTWRRTPHDRHPLDRRRPRRPAPRASPRPLDRARLARRHRTGRAHPLVRRRGAVVPAPARSSRPPASAAASPPSSRRACSPGPGASRRYSFELTAGRRRPPRSSSPTSSTGALGPDWQHAAGWEAYFYRLEAHLAGGFLSEEEAHAASTTACERYRAAFSA